MNDAASFLAEAGTSAEHLHLWHTTGLHPLSMSHSIVSPHSGHGNGMMRSFLISNKLTPPFTITR